MSSSRSSLTCRIEWQPSQVLLYALSVMTLLAALSLWLSALPRWAAELSTLVVLAHGFVLVRSEARREPFTLVWHGGEATATLNFANCVQSLSNLRVDFNGPLATLFGCDEHGRTHRWLWWPDTLPIISRRSLRIVADTGCKTNDNQATSLSS